MPLAVVNKETRLALKAIREIDQRSGGKLVAKARDRSQEDTTESMGEALAQAIRVAYAPFVMLAPPPTAAMLNKFMNKVDWEYVVGRLLIRPELN
jgi:hypothetical protein